MDPLKIKSCNGCKYSKYDNNGAEIHCINSNLCQDYELYESDDVYTTNRFKKSKCMGCVNYNSEKGPADISMCFSTDCPKASHHVRGIVDDMVNHPKHYNVNGMEAIDVVQAFTDGLNGIEATDTGNIIKYALRWKRKNGIEDLKKIVWYTNHLIKYLEGKNER